MGCGGKVCNISRVTDKNSRTTQNMPEKLDPNNERGIHIERDKNENDNFSIAKSTCDRIE